MRTNKRNNLNILFICKADDPFSSQAAGFLLMHYPTATVYYSTRNQTFPEDIYAWQGDLIISYLSQWIIPERVLKNAAIAAINFHPGPPEYPGIGCTNFAIYDSVDEFGITCHHMAPKVDTGEIIATNRFPVYEDDTVFSITQRCYNEILSLFYEIFYILMNGDKLPRSGEKWLRKPFVRKELNELCKLTSNMKINEVERRIKATTYLQPWAYMEIDEKIVRFSAEEVSKREYMKYLSSQ